MSRIKKLLEKADEACDIIDRLSADLKAKDELLLRCKKTFEPFPIVSDLKSMTNTLREKHSETETKAIKKLFEDKEREYRTLYKDIEQVLKENVNSDNKKKNMLS